MILCKEWPRPKRACFRSEEKQEAEEERGAIIEGRKGKNKWIRKRRCLTAEAMLQRGYLA